MCEIWQLIIKKGEFMAKKRAVKLKIIPRTQKHIKYVNRVTWGTCGDERLRKINAVHLLLFLV